jgi:hypothetical protein
MRHVRLPLPVILGGLIFGACKDKAEDTAPSADDTARGDTGEQVVPPCADGGGWGYIDPTDPEAVHVREGGDDESGTGTAAQPLASVQAALDLTRASAGERIIAVGAGSFELNLTLSRSDDETTIQGCGPAETVFEGADDEAPVLLVTGSSGITLEGISTRGGTRGIQAWSAATITLHDILVESSRAAGVIIHGNGTVASLEEVYVHGTLSVDDGSGGYGLAFQEGAEVAMTGGGAYDNTAAGIMVSDVESVALHGVIVEGTLQDRQGRYGRGVMIQDFASSVIIDEGSEIRDNHDAGVFALAPLSFTMSDSTVRGSLASVIPGIEDTSGDAVVVTRGTDKLDPSLYLAALTGNVIEEFERAGILFDGVTAAESDNTIAASDLQVVAQGQADVDSDRVILLDDEHALVLNLEPMLTLPPSVSHE